MRLGGRIATALIVVSTSACSLFTDWDGLSIVEVLVEGGVGEGGTTDGAANAEGGTSDGGPPGTDGGCGAGTLGSVCSKFDTNTDLNLTFYGGGVSQLDPKAALSPALGLLTNVPVNRVEAAGGNCYVTIPLAPTTTPSRVELTASFHIVALPPVDMTVLSIGNGGNGMFVNVSRTATRVKVNAGGNVRTLGPDRGPVPGGRWITVKAVLRASPGRLTLSIDDEVTLDETLEVVPVAGGDVTAGLGIIHIDPAPDETTVFVDDLVFNAY